MDRVPLQIFKFHRSGEPFGVTENRPLIMFPCMHQGVSPEVARSGVTENFKLKIRRNYRSHLIGPPLGTLIGHTPRIIGHTLKRIILLKN